MKSVFYILLSMGRQWQHGNVGKFLSDFTLYLWDIQLLYIIANDDYIKMLVVLLFNVQTVL